MKKEDDGLVVFEVGKPYPKRMPGGLYDKQIMCALCDHSIGPYDNTASRFFTWDVSSPLYFDWTGRKAYIIKDFDFGNIQLFLLAYLWRCHHSTIPMMRDFTIGAHFAEKIRQKLVAKDGCREIWFDFVLLRLENSRDLMPFKAPWRARAYDRNVIFAYILNWKVMAKLDSRHTPGELVPFVAKPGSDLVVRCDEYDGSPEFKNDLSTFRKIDSQLDAKFRDGS